MLLQTIVELINSSFIVSITSEREAGCMISLLSTWLLRMRTKHRAGLAGGSEQAAATNIVNTTSYHT